MPGPPAGAFALALPTRIGYETDRVLAATDGTSMRSSCVSPDNCAICIEPWIKIARSWIFSSRRGGIRKLRLAFFPRLIKQQGQTPRRLVTDKLRSYRPAHRKVMPGKIHDTSQYTNNRAELSHEPSRQRKRRMRRFKSIGHAQLFLSVHGTMKNALFSYNAKQSFGRVTFDTTAADPQVTYDVRTIDGEDVHSLTVKRSQLSR